MRLPTASPEGPIGAYGLRLEGIEGSRSLSVYQPSLVGETFHIRSEVHEPPWRESDIVTDSACGLAAPDRRRNPYRARARPRGLQDGAPAEQLELIHPYLAPVAAVAGYWFDRESFHAGAFVLGDGAWAVIGGREAGKSTLLASLALRGITVLSDDMLILDGDIPFPGPQVDRPAP